MAIVYTEEDLKRAGFVEVRPGVFARRDKKAVEGYTAAKQKPLHLQHIKTPTLTIGGKTIKFRSGWEADLCKYLEFLKRTGEVKDYEYEPHRFMFPIKRGSNSYLPDFRVDMVDGSHYWIELKGFMDEKSATKLKRFAKYFPDEKLVLMRKEEILDIRKSGVLDLKL